jgi:hypothetical protein
MKSAVKAIEERAFAEAKIGHRSKPALHTPVNFILYSSWVN